MTLNSINPATGELLAAYEEHTHEEVNEIVERSRRRFDSWRRAGFEDRAALLNEAARVLESRKDELARLMTAEMGKPIAGGRAEVEKCAWVCRYYADNAGGFLDDEHIDANKTKSYVHYEPQAPAAQSHGVSPQV